MRNRQFRFWVKRYDLERLFAAPRLCYLIGGYDGSSNYGDILLLMTQIRRLEQISGAPIGIPLIDARYAASHDDLIREHPGLFGNALMLYFMDGPRDDELDYFRGSDFVEVETPPACASQILIYGGGFFVEAQSWGTQKLDLTEAIEQWLGAVSSSSFTCPPLLFSGQQVMRGFLHGSESARFKDMISKAEAFGARDEVSLEVLGEEFGEPTGQWLFLSGDDAAPTILESAWRRIHDRRVGRAHDRGRGTRPFTLGLHLSLEGYVTDDPESLLLLASSIVRGVHHLVGGKLALNLLVAYDDRRISERQNIEKLRAGINDLDVRVNVVDVLDALLDGAEGVRDADLVVTCSYHVGLTSLLSSVPTLLLFGNACYAHKVEGLRRSFCLPDHALLDARQWSEVRLRERLRSLVTDHRFRTEFCQEVAGGVAWTSLANATAMTRFQQFFLGEQVGDLASKYAWTVDELRETMETLSDLRLEYSRLLNAEAKPVTRNGNGNAPLDVILYVVGGLADPDRNPAMRDFPLVNQNRGQSAAAHLEQITQLVDVVMAAGGTHLLVPRELADWLGDHPLVADYFAEHHVLAEASAEMGIVFTLRP